MAAAKKPTSYFLTTEAVEDLKFWTRNSPATVVRITKLLDAILTDPITGIGKPKPLKYSLEGSWSRRIDSEHRIIYEGVGDAVNIIALRGHYEK